MAEEEAGSGYLSGILNGIWSGKYNTVEPPVSDHPKCEVVMVA